VHILQPRPLPAQWRVPILQRMHTVRYDDDVIVLSTLLLRLMHACSIYLTYAKCRRRMPR
jgi:hypothetical protein